VPKAAAALLILRQSWPSWILSTLRTPKVAPDYKSYWNLWLVCLLSLMGRVWVESAGVAQHYLSATPWCQMFSKFLRIPKSACTDRTCGSLVSGDDSGSSSNLFLNRSSTGKRLRMTLWIHLQVTAQMSQVWRQTKISDQWPSWKKLSPSLVINEEF